MRKNPFKNKVFLYFMKVQQLLPMSFYGMDCGRAVTGKDWSVTTLSAVPTAGRFRIHPPATNPMRSVGAYAWQIKIDYCQ
jgi:hypothetical protein